VIAVIMVEAVTTFLVAEVIMVETLMVETLLMGGDYYYADQRNGGGGYYGGDLGTGGKGYIIWVALIQQVLIQQVFQWKELKVV
jgi:hypothetical protein